MVKMKSKNNSKVIKRPKKKITSHKRQHFAERVHAKLVAEGDVTMTPTLSQKNKGKKNANKPQKKKIQRRQKDNVKNLKELDASKRKNWVALNKKQIDFLSTAMNAAVGFAMTQVDTKSTEKFEEQSSFLNATQSILIQNISKVKVPPTSKSITKASSISKAKYIEMSKNMDATIQSLTEAIDKEKLLTREKEILLRDE